MISNQCIKIKSSIIDTNNHLNRIFPSFESLNSEFSPESRLIDIFSSLPITLYGFQMWYYNKTPLSYSLKTLEKLHRQAALWIVGAFKTNPIFSVEAIARLIPIHLHLQKLSERSQLRAHSLPTNHIL